MGALNFICLFINAGDKTEMRKSQRKAKEGRAGQGREGARLKKRVHVFFLPAQWVPRPSNDHFLFLQLFRSKLWSKPLVFKIRCN